VEIKKRAERKSYFWLVDNERGGDAASYHQTKKRAIVLFVIRVELACSAFSYDLIPLKGELHPSVWPRA